MMGAIAFLVFCAVPFAAGYVNQEGDPCNDGTWTCTLISDCETAIDDIMQGRAPDVCGYDPDTEERIVCCRPNNTPKKSISVRKCEEYAEAAYVSKYVYAKRKFVKQLDCGIKTEQLILGGDNATLKEFPHQAHIGFGNNVRTAKWSCGGSLISDQWILSAAHCAKTSLGHAKWARLGELNYKSDEDGADPKILGISTITIHKDYKLNENLYYDIALFKLEEKIRFTPHIRPLCLQQPDSQNSDRSAIASGWGHTAWAGRPSAMLQKVKLSYVPNDKCAEYYAGRAELPHGIIESQVCAGNEFNKDTCQGDSGGPLQRYLGSARCMYELVGLTSFGLACGSSVPGVYTRVSSFVPWIEKIVWPNE